ncbi:MAG: FtsQ-type POTRA domain-containing protein [Myxococcaceae bacterium]
MRTQSLKQSATRLGTLVLRVAVVIGLSGGLYFGATHGYRWATTSPTFALEDVTFTGHSRSTEGELLRLAGLAFGQNLFRMDVAALERAMDAHLWVRHVEVTRHFPSRIAVEVEEFEPAALVSLGELYLLDREGAPFKKLQAGDELDLPLVTGMTREEYVASPEKASGQFRAALELMAAWSGSKEDGTPAFGDVSEIRIAKDGMTVVTEKGVEVRMGLDDTPAKLARLEKVRSELTRRGLEAEIVHLDNRARPGWVTVKLPTPLSERKRGSVQ